MFIDKTFQDVKGLNPKKTRRTLARLVIIENHVNVSTSLHKDFNTIHNVDAWRESVDGHAAVDDGLAGNLAAVEVINAHH